MESILDDNRSMTFRMTVTAMFAAVTAVASWISVPLPFTPVPINLATLAVTLAGAVLGYKYGTISVLIYILLGAAGVPVFAGFTRDHYWRPRDSDFHCRHLLSDAADGLHAEQYVADGAFAGGRFLD